MFPIVFDVLGSIPQWEQIRSREEGRTSRTMGGRDFTYYMTFPTYYTSFSPTAATTKEPAQVISAKFWCTTQKWEYLLRHIETTQLSYMDNS